MKKFALIGALVATAILPVLAQDAPKEAAAKKVEGPTVCTINGKILPDASKAGGKAEYKGKTYYFCCGNCQAKFNSSDDAAKAKFAKISDLRVEKMALQKKLESVDTELKALTGEPKPVAAATPAVVYCAVTDEEIGTPDKAAMKVEYSGKSYYLCCPGCKPKFEADPAKYAAEADKKAAERAAKK